MSEQEKKSKGTKKISLVETARVILKQKGNCWKPVSILCGDCFNKSRCGSGNGTSYGDVNRRKDSRAFIKRSEGKSKKIKAKPVDVQLRPNFVKALKDRVHIHVDTTSKISEELQQICVANKVLWYSGRYYLDGVGTFFIRATDNGYCMIMGGDGIRYRPETDTFDQVTQVPGSTKKVYESQRPTQPRLPRINKAKAIRDNAYNCVRDGERISLCTSCPIKPMRGYGNTCGCGDSSKEVGFIIRKALIDNYIAENDSAVDSNSTEKVADLTSTLLHFAEKLRDNNYTCITEGGGYLIPCASCVLDSHTCSMLLQGGEGFAERKRKIDSFIARNTLATDKVESPKTESYPNLREALRAKKEFFIYGNPVFFADLKVILPEEGVKINYNGLGSFCSDTSAISFAFTREGLKRYMSWVGKIGDKQYFPETDSFDSAEKVAVTSVSSEDVVIAKKTCKNCTRFDLVNGECPLTHNVSLGFVCNEWTDKPIEKVDSSDPVDLGMTGKCCDNTNLSLTIGKQYAILAVTRFGFKIRNDKGNIEEYTKERFESIEPVETKKTDTEKVKEKVFWQYVLENDLKDYPGCRFGMCKVCPYAEDTGACLIPSKYPLLDRCNNVAMQSMARKQLEKSGLMTPSEIKSSDEMRIFSPGSREEKFFMLNLNEKATSNLKKLLDSNPGKLSVQWSEPWQGSLQVKVPEYVWIVADDGLLKRKSSQLHIRVVDGALKVDMFNFSGVHGFFDFCYTIDEAYALYKAGENK